MLWKPCIFPVLTALCLLETEVPKFISCALLCLIGPWKAGGTVGTVTMERLCTVPWAAPHSLWLFLL